MPVKSKDNHVEKIYQNIVKISRSKFFYIDYNLEDSFETRFDLIIFHSFMIFYFYKSISFCILQKIAFAFSLRNTMEMQRKYKGKTKGTQREYKESTKESHRENIRKTEERTKE